MDKIKRKMEEKEEEKMDEGDAKTKYKHGKRKKDHDEKRGNRKIEAN